MSLITCENVSKAWSAAFSPPLLTKASSLSFSSPTFCSTSPETHTVKPNEAQADTHWSSVSASEGKKTQLPFKYGGYHSCFNHFFFFFNEFLMKSWWHVIFFWLAHFGTVIRRWCEIICVSTVIYNRQKNTLGAWCSTVWVSVHVELSLSQIVPSCTGAHFLQP